MCDYSLKHVQSRPAKVGDKLITKDFGTGTLGFASIDDADKVSSESTAVCVLPGTEIAFDKPAASRTGWFGAPMANSQTAIFRQVDIDKQLVHHDALEFAGGDIVKLTMLCPGQKATVLQLPAAPKTEAEEKEQQRLEVVA